MKALRSEIISLGHSGAPRRASPESITTKKHIGVRDVAITDRFVVMDSGLLASLGPGMTIMPTIKPDRLLGDLYKLRSFGAYKTGVHRPTFSPEDIAARAWFAERCTEAGLETTIDGIGNILGK